MGYAPVIILHAPPWDSPALEHFVEDCIRDNVSLVCVIGPDCQRVEDVIDELVVSDGSNPERFIQTSSHLDEDIGEVREFASAWRVNGRPAEMQEVVLTLP